MYSNFWTFIAFTSHLFWYIEHASLSTKTTQISGLSHRLYCETQFTVENPIFLVIYVYIFSFFCSTIVARIIGRVGGQWHRAEMPLKRLSHCLIHDQVAQFHLALGEL